MTHACGSLAVFFFEFYLGQLILVQITQQLFVGPIKSCTLGFSQLIKLCFVKGLIFFVGTQECCLSIIYHVSRRKYDFGEPKTKALLSFI